jgi:tetratricopeptide (TPR) repeat protein
MESSKHTNTIFRKTGLSIVAVLFTIFSTVWAYKLGLGNPMRSSLAFVTLSCSFFVGSLVGFVVTIFGDEIEALGKARDSMIAVLSGITGIGVAKMADLGGLLGRIQLFPQQTESSSWFSVLFITTYTISGFYAMYFFRKLFLNPALADAHEKLERKTKISNRASEVLIEIEKKLPKGILTGRETIEETDAQDDDSKVLKEALLTDDVDEFLATCDDEVTKGALSPDLISKASVLHYYRIRFLPLESPERDSEIDKAIEWLTRATMIDPLNPEPQLKLAEVYGLSNEDATCIAILDRLEDNDLSPLYLDQWLGFYLLFGENREEDAIKHTLEYLKRFPDQPEASFLNIARAYAQMLKRKNQDDTRGATLHREYRASALEYLKKAINIDPDLKGAAKKLAESSESFEALAKDPEFLEVVAQDPKHS